MSEKKVTAKDIAREAGVSVATVSYVLNGRTDQKISPQTRKKILQIANLMNYMPSHAAKSLATGRNNTVGIAYLLNDSLTRTASMSLFINMLIERLNRMKYDVTFIPVRRDEAMAAPNRSVDAIIAVDLSGSDFRLLADSYLVPVICVDMIVSDPLFYRIYDDIPFLVEKALMEMPASEKYYYLYDSCCNEDYENFVLSLPDNVFPLRSKELSPSVITRIKDSSVIVNGGYLALYALSFLPKTNVCALIAEEEQNLLPADCRVIMNNTSKKANMAINIAINSIVRNFELNHDQRIR